MWLILALVTAVFWAIGIVMLKKGVNYLPLCLVYLLNALAFGAWWFLYWLINGGWQFNWTAAGLALLPGVAFVFTLTALSRAEAALISVAGSINPLVTAGLAVLFLGERLNIPQGVLIAAVISGIVIMAWPEKLSGKISRGIVWGLGYGLIYGVINFSGKYAIDTVGPTSYSLMNTAWMLLISLVWLLIEGEEKKLLSLVKSVSGKQTIAATIVFNLGGLAFFLAVAAGQVSLVMPVVNLYVPLICILAWWWLKEKMTRRQMAGAGVIVASVILLSLMS
ncbi:hypothetical protein COW80_00850 [Candidatus Beckwithbacteria bacterium CG22_combo_CG10-13_8_21_14_all_01_47_9]|uniref:EamA domain-containing protein n=3 Tax=Candidatus Beckwithiibacteriota TaxID=1752726 RepID=A0A2H0E1N5_9BACT|nr:MAG: hypothetical protein COW80_00850 [Candidatus Beckwithbacteria bacterium CG22_combo_CG10-13_8_21_14_all_01_47_9]PJA21657.1 MAG: hypothetical protein COX59_03935 [Candidatus Beckwithbacteria bacterium CG_4_10_14_0_2_um_filter_47_25]PJC66431.1 MAG: hypothetical protein CO018_01925 [Candidatus Beckwithbacteria bacterium CG_4_9_14_0_2_um_filter_47_11]